MAGSDSFILPCLFFKWIILLCYQLYGMVESLISIICFSFIDRIVSAVVPQIKTIIWTIECFGAKISIVQFSHSVVSDSLQHHGLQHTKLPCLSPTPGAYPNSCPLSWWYHPTISSFVVPFSSCPQSHPATGSFPMSQFFTSGVQILEFRFNISPSNVYSGLVSFRMDWLDLLAVQGTLKSLLHSSKAPILQHSAFLIVQLSDPYMTTGKTIALTRWIFVGKVMSLLFTMLSRLVITFLPRSKHLLISWLQSPSAVILEPLKIKSVTVSTVSSSICYEVMGSDATILVFWILSFQPTFHSPLSLSSRGFLAPLHFLP